jgi:hypothetical protein
MPIEALLLRRFQAIDLRHDPVQTFDLLFAVMDGLGHPGDGGFGLVGQGIGARPVRVLDSHALESGVPPPAVQ